jgi:L-fuconolactonase
MDLLDAHVHLFATGFSGLYGRACSGGDDLLVYESFRREYRIAGALVLGYEGETPYHGNNEYVARLSVENSWMSPLAFTPAAAPRFPAAPFLGITVFLMSDDDVRRFVAWPAEVVDLLTSAEMIVSINCVPAALAGAGEALRRLDGCQVLVSHLGQPGVHDHPPPDGQISRILEPLLSLSSAEHIGVKLSGLYDVSSPAHAFPHSSAHPFIERIADAFGTDRLYWGSDFSPALDHVSFVQTIHAVSDLAWSPHEREAIMGGNLRHLLQRVPPRAA